MTRARAKYGSRLSYEDYASLAGVSGLREIVSFLRTKKALRPILMSSLRTLRSQEQSLRMRSKPHSSPRLRGFAALKKASATRY